MKVLVVDRKQRPTIIDQQTALESVAGHGLPGMLNASSKPDVLRLRERPVAPQALPVRLLMGKERAETDSNRTNTEQTMANIGAIRTNIVRI